MREYKLPVIEDRYFVELSEANEAILEVIKELSKETYWNKNFKY